MTPLRASKRSRRYKICPGRSDMMVTNRIEVDHQAVAYPNLYDDTVPAPFTRPERA